MFDQASFGAHREGRPKILQILPSSIGLRRLCEWMLILDGGPRRVEALLNFNR